MNPVAWKMPGAGAVPRFVPLLVFFTACVVGCGHERRQGFREDSTDGAGGQRAEGPGGCEDLAHDACIACCTETSAADPGNDWLAACACGPICGPTCPDACEGGSISFDCLGCVTDAIGREICSMGETEDPCVRACPEDGGPSTGGSTGSATTGPSAGSGGSSADAPQACVDRINQYRGALGLPAYARWSRAETCADGQAESDSQSGEAHGAFTRCGEWAQNECPGWPGAPGAMIGECLEAMWGEGPGGGHYENMSSTEYTEVACGFHVTASGDVWAVQDFR